MLKQLRAFLRLIGYYIKVICQYVIITIPLTSLLANDKFIGKI